MKHRFKIMAVLLAMFLITQFLGLYVVNSYSPEEKPLPFGMDYPAPADLNCKITLWTDFFKCTESLYPLLFSLVIAFFIFFLFTRFDVAFILKLWFFLVVTLALTISLNSFISFKYSLAGILVFAAVLSFFKIYQHNLLVHNMTELLIYPGIAAVFVPILNIWSAIILLIILSVYDIWAVWHSGIMIKIAKYQMNRLHILGGFLLPYISRKIRYKLSKMKKSELRKKKVKVNVAILGGGDIIFPIIAAGVMLKTFGLLSALFVTAGATLGLLYLFFFAKKKKFYPAMPFITAGIFAGMITAYLLL